LNTVTLQRGTWPNATVADLYLSSYHETTNLGASNNIQDQREYYSTLLGCAILQSEARSGSRPSPDRFGAVVVPQAFRLRHGVQLAPSAASLVRNHRHMESAGAWAALVERWREWRRQRLRSHRRCDSLNALGPRWIVFHLSAVVASMSQDAARADYGWRLRSIRGDSNLKRMYSSEYVADPGLRPKLVISYR
jgi:hypothetical protein